VNPPKQVPTALNGFTLWNVILLLLMVVAYGFPVGQFFVLKTSVPAYELIRPTTGASMR
jgi:cytochrome c oxidase subunit 1